jgi:subfamily B ATP-binding cassette protein MsbA
MEKKDLSMTIFKRLWHDFLKSQRKMMAGAFFLMAISSLSTAGLAKLMKPVIDDIFIAHQGDRLVWIGALVLITFMAKGLSTFGADVLLTTVGQRVIANLQMSLFNRLIHCDLSFFHHRTTGQLISHFTNDTGVLRGVVTNTLTSIGKDTLTLAALVGLMFYQDSYLASIAFFAFPAAVLPIRYIGRKMRKVAGSTQAQMGTLTGFLTQSFQGILLIKSAGTEAYESQRAEKVVTEVMRLVQKATRIRSASHPIMETLGGIAVVTIILYGGWQVIQGAQTTGAFISFISALLLAYEPLKRLVNLNASLQEGMASAARLFSLLDTPIQIQNKPGAPSLQIKEGGISFQNVSFGYDPAHPVIKNLSLEIKGGETVALVGPSGGGKSTLIHLIPRFYEIQKGGILIDGQDIQNVTLESLRNSMALVSQHVTLFNDTVSRNIGYGEEVIDQERLVASAQDAAAHDFIMQLPQGYDTLIGEQGVTLSGGQRQRLSIARALYKNAKILLMDEATSALDNESEKLVQGALRRLMKNRTTILVAHRLSTVQEASRIYVIDQGSVVELGTYGSLMELGGVFSRLAKSNF